MARRRGMSVQATIGQVAEWLYALTRMSRRDRIALRNKVESHANFFDWSNLIGYYVAAHKMALQRRGFTQELVPVDPELDREPRETPATTAAPVARRRSPARRKPANK